MEEMMNTEVLGEEDQGLAEPGELEVEEGEGEQEVAEPVAEHDADAAFAEMRREKEKLAAENKRMQEALGLFFDGDDPVVDAHAFYEDKTPEEIQAEFEAQEAMESLLQEKEELENDLTNYRAKELMNEGLKEIQSIFPDVKSLEDVCDKYPSFPNYVSSGLDSVQAYFAAKAETEATKVIAPKNIGKVNASPAEKGFFSKEEVEAMSSEEVKKNYDVIRASMSKWEE